MNWCVEDDAELEDECQKKFEVWAEQERSCVDLILNQFLHDTLSSIIVHYVEYLDYSCWASLYWTNIFQQGSSQSCPVYIYHSLILLIVWKVPKIGGANISRLSFIVVMLVSTLEMHSPVYVVFLVEYKNSSKFID